MLQNVHKPLCTAGICDTSETMKGYQKTLIKEENIRVARLGT